MYHYVVILLLLVFHNVIGASPTSIGDACTLPLDTFYILDDGQIIYHAHTWLSTIKFTWTDGNIIDDYTGTIEFPTWTISDSKTSISFGLGEHRRLEDRHKLIREHRKAHPIPTGFVEQYIKHSHTRRRLLHDTNTGAPASHTYTGFPTENPQNNTPITTYCGVMVNITFATGTVSRGVVALDVDHGELVLESLSFTQTTAPYNVNVDLDTPCNPNPCAGDCEIHGESYKCKCPPGRYGERCFDTLYTVPNSMLLIYSVAIAVIATLCMVTCLSITNACLPVKTVFKKIITPAANNAIPATRPLRF